MKIRIIYAFIVGTVIAMCGLSANAADEQVGQDETTVLGACMIQRITDKMPNIKEEKFSQCADEDPSAVSKCLGLSDEEYLGMVSDCKGQLINAKCVSKKMKVSLYEYANCGYEKDPVACYKGLGFSLKEIVDLSKECTDEGS